jgi:hypothetical protein
MTWRDIATGRGFTDLGDRTWTAPNGQIVPEGFVAAYCRPERLEADEQESSPQVLTGRNDGHILPTNHRTAVRQSEDYRHPSHLHTR